MPARRSETTSGPNRRLLALNHFANPPQEPGGTRMVDLAAHLQSWSTLVLASDRNLLTRRPRRVRTATFRTVATLPYRGNGWSRVANWLSYALSALAVGLRAPRPDVVLGSSPHLLAPLAALVLARRFRAALVVEVRDLWPQVLVETQRLRAGSIVHRLLVQLEEFLYRRADAVIVLTQGVHIELRRRGVDPAKLHLIPNGASPADWVPVRPRDDVRRELGWSGPILVYAGAHGPANGLGLLLDAAPTVAEVYPDARIVLLGDGVQKLELQARVQQECLHNVVFLDAVPKDEMADILGAADIGVHVLADLPLFRYGVSPNKLYDYLAAGLPVVTNTGGEVAETVRSVGAGVATQPDDLAAGLLEALAMTTAERARCGELGKTWLESHRTREQMAARLHVALEGALQRTRSA